MNEQNNLPNMTVVKGVLAVLIGILFVLFSYKVILRMIFFTSGILLIYYGLNVLNIPALNNALATTKEYLKKILP